MYIKIKKENLKVFAGLLLVFGVFLFSGCNSGKEIRKEQAKAQDKLSCTADSDCVCGGIDKENNNCFIGNKNYYELNVDKTRSCPDFCTGIAGNLITQCINNTCKITSRGG